MVRLQVHLKNMQAVTWNPTQVADLREVVDPENPQEEKLTTLTGWFKANRDTDSEDIHNTLYQDFPSKMVWVQKDRRWKPRSQGFAIGRMYHAHPTSGERFYLRLLLTVVRGATCWDDLYTFEGIMYNSFREVCIARGLLEDDHEWHQCLQEARHMQTGSQLRHLFVTILCDCSPADPRALWETFWPYICDDLKHHLKHQQILENASEAEIQDYGLYLIDQLLSQKGRKLEEWTTMPQSVENWGAILGNPLIREQQNYDVDELAAKAAECIASLNGDQHVAFERIISAITTKSGEIFFLHGPGGTGKTYLYNTLCYHLRSQHKIVLCVASSGIAALLLQGGRTSHSAFKIPIPCHESTVCNFAKNSHLGELIRVADLVIWDEAPMQHRHIIETVDRSFKDVRDCDKPFGGLSIVFGGDFQQILPVITKGSQPQIVGAYMQRSRLWRCMTLLHLKQNM